MNSSREHVYGINTINVQRFKGYPGPNKAVSVLLDRRSHRLNLGREHWFPDVGKNY